MSLPAPTDEELARRAAAGNRAALGELIRRHWKRLFGFLRRLGVPNDDIDDVAQEVWAKVTRHAEVWDGNFTWVMHIARNAVKDWRKKKRLPTWTWTQARWWTFARRTLCRNQTRSWRTAWSACGRPTKTTTPPWSVPTYCVLRGQ